MPKLITNYKDWAAAKGLKFDEDMKERFLQKFAETGRIQHSALSVGVTKQTVANHRKSDPDFEEAFQEAKAAYADHVQAAVHKLAIEGVLEPILGGQWKDEIITHKRVYATNLLALEAKRVNPEYRENNNINVNVQAGVLLVPSSMSVSEWEAKHAPPVQPIKQIEAQS